MSAAALVSVRLTLADDRTAASLVPRMSIVDRGVGAVGAHHVEAVGVVLAVDELVVRRARGVGPGAVGADRERAVAAGGAGLRHEGRRAVDVADGQRAGGRDVGRRVGLGQVDGGRRQNRGVVGAEDVDVDRGVGAVGAHHVEALGVVLAVDELVVGGARGVGPGAVGADRERAVAADGAGLRHEGRRAVDVADGQRAGGPDGGRALVSVRSTLADDRTAASLVPMWSTGVAGSTVAMT